MARLIHLNGPPGAGKSTVARIVADESPPMLVVEIDEIRTRLANWRTDPETRLRARELAVTMIEDHLAAGHDVIVPQFLGRPEFIRRLADVAAERGAEFHELILDIDPDAAVDRFRARRAEFEDGDVQHPERDVADDDIVVIIDEAIGRLARLDVPGVRATRLACTTADEAVAAIRRAIV